LLTRARIERSRILSIPLRGWPSQRPSHPQQHALKRTAFVVPFECSSIDATVPHVDKGSDQLRCRGVTGAAELFVALIGKSSKPVRFSLGMICRPISSLTVAR
jgi:hypothetical protein